MRRLIGFLLAIPMPIAISHASTGAGLALSVAACLAFAASLWKGLHLLTAKE
jgi:hypothetical protein